MTTAFALIADRCGLSHREAANFLAVRLDTVKSWSSGRNTAPATVISELRKLHLKIERSAIEAMMQIEELRVEHGDPGEIELGLASDDVEAASLGWPCVGAHAALLGRVAALCELPVKIVPRGSTVATAGAADEFER